MNILWIIGNGFDLQMGLKTSYLDFYERCYSKEETTQAVRARLAALAGGLGDENLVNWANLEKLLGEATQLYDSSEKAAFSGDFEEMQRLLVDYLRDEQSGFVVPPVDNVLYDEMWYSLTRFDQRLAPPNLNRMVNIIDSPEPITYSIMSLNYTTVFDAMLANVHEYHEPFDVRVIDLPKQSPLDPDARTVTCEDVIMPVFHVHGELESADVVFGVSHMSQISNAEFANDGDFVELWQKSGKNALYANGKTSQMEALVANADVMCLYGCSIGETDDYIWKTIGDRLLASNQVRLVVFDHRVAPFEELFGLNFQSARNGIVKRFAEASHWDSSVTRLNRDKIIVEPSSTVFMW